MTEHFVIAECLVVALLLDLALDIGSRSIQRNLPFSFFNSYTLLPVLIILFLLLDVRPAPDDDFHTFSSAISQCEHIFLLQRRRFHFNVL